MPSKAAGVCTWVSEDSLSTLYLIGPHGLLRRGCHGNLSLAFLILQQVHIGSVGDCWIPSPEFELPCLLTDGAEVAAAVEQVIITRLFRKTKLEAQPSSEGGSVEAPDTSSLLERPIQYTGRGTSYLPVRDDLHILPDHETPTAVRAAADI
eukprot:TRINITY_DN407_c0_g2_i1.p2 TRINITY_DN407_c0_g2~~TRINITY_DN407_c0_g2_i1.p2  ORF type:complete len:151 (-),score=17.99 TRINITY_DN407_c0_g2_i1:239-691(-)